MQSKWYTLYTRENCEKNVTSFFRKKGFNSYCPMNKIIKAGIIKKQTISFQPLFKEYVFVFINDNMLSLINENDNIINFVFWLGRPVTLTDFEITNIKNFTALYHDVKLEKTTVKLNRANGMTSKLYKSNTCEDDGIDVENKKISITIHSLGYRLVSNIEISEIEFTNDLIYNNKLFY